MLLVTIVCVIAIYALNFNFTGGLRSDDAGLSVAYVDMLVSGIWGWFLHIYMTGNKDSIKQVERSCRKLLAVFQVQITALANRIHDQSVYEELSDEWLQGAGYVMHTLSQTMTQSLQTTGELIRDLDGDAGKFMERGATEFSSMHKSAESALSEIRQRPGIMGLFEYLPTSSMLNTQEPPTLSQDTASSSAPSVKKTDNGKVVKPEPTKQTREKLPEKT